MLHGEFPLHLLLRSESCKNFMEWNIGFICKKSFLFVGNSFGDYFDGIFIKFSFIIKRD